ncbi:NPCBM/NEW2 domain-containing protein [[Ruminococcus] torques]|nr:NPCBM/NEW2 domain-containing protein [[Ruminococcus] torques]
MESQMELNVLSGNADSGKVYSRAKFDPIKAEAEAKLAQESTTKEELEAVFQQLEQFKMEFQDELGTGVYVSDLTHLSGNTAWGGVKKDLCPDGNRLIAVKKDTSTINTYTKGIGAHEPSSIVYDVTGYKMFSADIGVENHQIASDGGVFANVKAKFKVSTSTDGSNYTQQYYAEDLSANGGLRSIRVKLPEGTTHMKLECPASAWNNGNGGKLHTCWANAKLYETVEIAVTGITLDQDALALKVGGTEEQKTATLQAAITPEDATDQEVLWESDNEEVATVDGGVVTAHKAGNATIKVSSVNYPNITAQCIVTVTRDDTALEEAIAAAESRMKEENFAEKYTEATRKALEDDLADAKAAKDNTALSVEEVKWIVESLKTSIEGLQLKAVVTINNNGNTETKYCEVGDQVRVVAQNVEDKKFSHWTFNGTPICYSSPYTFTVYGNTTIEAVYVENNVVVEKKAIVTVTAFYDKATSKANFLVKRSLPEGSTVKEHGIILTDSTGWDKLGKEGFVINAERTVKGTAKTKGLIGNYSYAMKSTRATTWYGKGYVIYTDKTGEEHTLYSDVVPCEVIR